MKELNPNSRDSVAFATAYYPTVFTSALGTPKAPIGTSPDFPTMSSTGSANELNLKDVVPYLKHLSLSEEHVIYKPPTAIQLSNISAKTYKRVRDTHRPVPTITLAVETGPFAFNFRYINEVSEADKIGKMCPPDPVELDGISMEVAGFKPDVEESYWEGEFWRALTAARGTGQKTDELIKQSLLRRQRLLALSRASMSTVMGSPTLNTTVTPLSSKMSINSTPMSNSFELNNIISFNSGSLWRVHHPGYFPHNSLISTPSAGVEQSHQKKLDTDASLATPITTTAQRNAKGFLRRARFNEKQRSSFFSFRKNLTLQGHNHSPSHATKSQKGIPYRENSNPTNSEKRGFKIPLPSIASESSGCLDVNSFVESAPTSTLPTCAETPITIHMNQNNASSFSSPLNTQNIYVNDVIGLARLHSHTTTTMSQRAKGTSRENTSNGIGSTTVEASQSRAVAAQDGPLSERRGETAMIGATSSCILSKLEPQHPQDSKSSSRGKLSSICTLPSFSTIRRDKSPSSKHFLNSVRSIPVVVSGTEPLDNSSVRQSQLTSVDASCTQRTNQPSSAAAAKDDPLSPHFIISGSTHPESHLGESPNVRTHFPGSSTASPTFEQIKKVWEPNESVSNVLYDALDQDPSQERNILAVKKPNQISCLSPEINALMLPSKTQSPRQELKVKMPKVCLDDSQNQHHGCSQPVQSKATDNVDYLHHTKPSRHDKNTQEGRKPTGCTALKTVEIPSRSSPKPRPFCTKKLVSGTDLFVKGKLSSSIPTQAGSDDKHMPPLAHDNNNGASITLNDPNVHCVLATSASPSSVLPSQLLNSKPEGKHNFENSSCNHHRASSSFLSVSSSARVIRDDSLHSCQPSQYVRIEDTPSSVNNLREGVGDSNNDTVKRKRHPSEGKTGEFRCCVVM